MVVVVVVVVGWGWGWGINRLGEGKNGLQERQGKNQVGVEDEVVDADWPHFCDVSESFPLISGLFSAVKKV